MIKPETVKAYRKANNLNQAAMAKQMGISYAKYRCFWEKKGIEDIKIQEATGIVNLLKFQDKTK